MTSWCFVAPSLSNGDKRETPAGIGVVLYCCVLVVFLFRHPPKEFSLHLPGRVAVCYSMTSCEASGMSVESYIAWFRLAAVVMLWWW